MTYDYFLTVNRYQKYLRLNFAFYQWIRVDGAMMSISSGRNFVVAANNGDGRIYYRSGVSAYNPTGVKWIVSTRRFTQISVGGMVVVGVQKGNQQTFISPLNFRGPATAFADKDEAMSACAGRSYCNGVVYRYHNNPHGQYFLANKDSKLGRTGNHEIAYPKIGESTSYGGYYWISMDYFVGQQYDTIAYTSLNVARTKCLASTTCGGVSEIDGKFYTNNGYGVTTGAEGTKLYTKNGAVIVEKEVTMAYG